MATKSSVMRIDRVKAVENVIRIAFTCGVGASNDDPVRVVEGFYQRGEHGEYRELFVADEFEPMRCRRAIVDKIAEAYEVMKKEEFVEYLAAAREGLPYKSAYGFVDPGESTDEDGKEEG